MLHIRGNHLGGNIRTALKLGEKLESGLYSELTDKELKDPSVEYTLLYDTIANRISIEDVQAKDGRLRLMAEMPVGSMTSFPHMLIAGVNRRRKDLLRPGPLLKPCSAPTPSYSVLDPKNAGPWGFTGGYAGCKYHKKRRYARLY